MGALMKVVISQPMFFPWVGMFEQIRLADVYIHYSDVQFSKGSMVNRVQIKTAAGVNWLTVPLHGLSLGQKIDEVRIDDRKDWRQRHLAALQHAYAGAPFATEMLALVESVYDERHATIAQLSEASLSAVCRYCGLDAGRRFLHARDLGVGGGASRRVLELVLAVGGDRYVSGLGASRYLDHAIFDEANIDVQYMDYRKIPYPQLHGAFTPYVSVLDLIANLGQNGEACIRSETIYWKDFIKHE